MAVFNSIIIGSAWSQAFTLDPAAIDVAGGETLRANFRANSAAPLLFQIDEPTGISRSGSTYTIGLTGVQTGQLATEDQVFFDMYAVKAGITRPLGVRVRVPVVNGL